MTVSANDFIKAVNLFQASVAAGDKVKRNASKLAFMDATRRMADYVLAFEGQLEVYRLEAQDAAKAFSDFVMGWPTAEIVFVIESA